MVYYAKCHRCGVSRPEPLAELADKGDWTWVNWHSEDMGWKAAFLCPDCADALERWMIGEGG